MPGREAPPEVVQEAVLEGETVPTEGLPAGGRDAPAAALGGPTQRKSRFPQKRGKGAAAEKDALAEIERKSVEKIQRLGTDKLLPLICKIAIPNIVGMTTTAIYNNADSAFVGQYMGQDGLTANGLFAPMENLLVVSVVVALSNGASSLISPAFGRRDFQATNYYITVFSILCYCWAVLLPICTLPWLDTFLRVLGASTPAVLEYSRQYALIVLTAGTVAVEFSLGTGALIRSENRSVLSMGRQILGAALNVVLDAMLFATLVAQMGYYCASVSTAVSQLAVGLWMLLNLLGVCKGGVLRLDYRLLGRGKEVFAEGYDVVGVKGGKGRKGRSGVKGVKGAKGMGGKGGKGQPGAAEEAGGSPGPEPRLRHIRQVRRDRRDKRAAEETAREAAGVADASDATGATDVTDITDITDDRPILSVGMGDCHDGLGTAGAAGTAHAAATHAAHTASAPIEMQTLGLESSASQALEPSVSVLNDQSVADVGGRRGSAAPGSARQAHPAQSAPAPAAVNAPRSNAGAFFHVAGQVLAQGLPSYINSVPAFLGVLIGNVNLSRYGGEKADMYRAALGLFSRVQMFVTLPSRGFYLTFQSILGYQLGARLYDRTYRLLVMSIIVDILIVAVLWALSEGLAYYIMAIFVKADNPELREMGAFALRLGIAAYPMVPLVELASGLSQYERRAVLASCLQLSRMVVTIAAQFVLPLVVPEEPALGVYYAFPVGDALGGVFGLAVYVRECLRYRALARTSGDAK